MKLIRYGTPQHERPGILASNDTLYDLSEHIPDITGDTFSDSTLAKLQSLNLSTLKKVGTLEAVHQGDLRLGAPIHRVGKIVCTGLNYIEHLEETHKTIPNPSTLPSEPPLFMKATSAINGPYDPVELPPNATELDWEIELAVIIGKRAKHITAETALGYVAGYTICNDISERTFQLHRQGQWTKGKSHDTFAPLGPYILTRDELPTPSQLNLTLSVNGTVRQQSSTAAMRFDVPSLIAYVSQFMTLEPGDILLTGTPGGVSLGSKDLPYLRGGDEMTLSITHLGTQKVTVKSLSPQS